jgi:hypothetical protein
LSYANVVATMALVFAMGGTAVAAKHYLISSTSQISPQVLKALELKIASRVKPGSPGTEGAQGKEGPAGKEGKEGAAGKDGTDGTNGLEGTGKESPAGKEGAPGKEGPAGKEGAPGKEGKEGKAVDISLLTEAEQNELKSILSGVSYRLSGIDGKPTIQFSGVNVQIISGAGTEQAAVNGAGNLVVGYDESVAPGTQTGSNNIVIGSSAQAYTSYGAILGGEHNLVEGPFSDAFGAHNEAVGEAASVSGGDENHADGQWSSVSGGYENTTEEDASSVSGGNGNQALTTQAWVGGGYHNKATGGYSSVAGGKEKTATALYEPLL